MPVNGQINLDIAKLAIIQHLQQPCKKNKRLEGSKCFDLFQAMPKVFSNTSTGFLKKPSSFC
jgi:hypothetical protein